MCVFVCLCACVYIYVCGFLKNHINFTKWKQAILFWADSEECNFYSTACQSGEDPGNHSVFQMTERKPLQGLGESVSVVWKARGKASDWNSEREEGKKVVLSKVKVSGCTRVWEKTGTVQVEGM